MHKGLYPQKGITFIVFYNKYKNIHKRFHMIERRIYIYIFYFAGDKELYICRL